MRKEEKGITLIALVVTIVVLLILAGVSISMLTGENGIITRAQDAKESTEQASIEEEVKLEVLGSFDNTGKYNKDLAIANLQENLDAEVELNDRNNTLKVTYKGESFLVDQNGNVFKIAVPEDLEIGDEVSYTPKVQEYLWQSKYSGASSDINLNNSTEDYSITKWKILNINDDGTIDLIAEKPTKGTVTLASAQGYNNGVKLLNDACNKLYGDKELGIVSRSINIEDIESKMNKETLDSIKDSGTNSPVLCGEQITNAYSSENSKYPAIYAEERKSVVNGKENENGLGVSEQDDFIEQDFNGAVGGGITDVESIQPYQTYYYRNQNDVQTFFSGDGIGTSNLLYNLLMPEGVKTMYWIASRTIHVTEEKCEFGLRGVFWRNE